MKKGYEREPCTYKGILMTKGYPNQGPMLSNYPKRDRQVSGKHCVRVLVF